MDILIEIGRVLLYIYWMWVISKQLSKVVFFFKKDNLSVLVYDIDRIKTCRKYCSPDFLNDGKDGYNSFLKLEPLLNKYPNIGIYFAVKTVVLKDTVMIKDIENYKKSKNTINKFNL